MQLACTRPATEEIREPQYLPLEQKRRFRIKRLSTGPRYGISLILSDFDFSPIDLEGHANAQLPRGMPTRDARLRADGHSSCVDHRIGIAQKIVTEGAFPLDSTQFGGPAPHTDDWLSGSSHTRDQVHALKGIRRIPLHLERSAKPDRSLEVSLLPSPFGETANQFADPPLVGACRAPTGAVLSTGRGLRAPPFWSPTDRSVRALTSEPWRNVCAPVDRVGGASHHRTEQG